MRFRGKDYFGRGVTVAIIDSGLDPNDPRMEGVEYEGWSIQFGATGHALLDADCHDESGHGTEIAAAVRHFAPGARLLAIKIMDESLRTNADLMAAGLETAYRNGAQVLNLSMGTPNMGKALLLRDCCAMAVENGCCVLAAAHPRGERAYPADLPEACGVASHPDCPVDKYYYFAPHRFPRREWAGLSGKFLAYGYSPQHAAAPGKKLWRGSGIATAYLAGRVACLREALPDEDADGITEILRQLALTPVPEIGYA